MGMGMGFRVGESNGIEIGIEIEIEIWGRRDGFLKGVEVCRFCFRFLLFALWLVDVMTL